MYALTRCSPSRVRDSGLLPLLKPLCVPSRPLCTAGRPWSRPFPLWQSIGLDTVVALVASSRRLRTAGIVAPALVEAVGTHGIVDSISGVHGAKDEETARVRLGAFAAVARALGVADDEILSPEVRELAYLSRRLRSGCVRASCTGAWWDALWLLAFATAARGLGVADDEIRSAEMSRPRLIDQLYLVSGTDHSEHRDVVVVVTSPNDDTQTTAVPPPPWACSTWSYSRTISSIISRSRSRSLSILVV